MFIFMYFSFVLTGLNENGNWKMETYACTWQYKCIQQITLLNNVTPVISRLFV